jgi:hypothetical protein
MAFVVRTAGDPAAMVPAVRAAVSELDPRAAIFEVRPLTEYVDAARATRRFTMILAAALAGVALLLACVGVYAVLAYAVAGRRHELGVRRALGASHARVVGAVFGEGLGFALAGSVVGFAGALVAGRLLQTQIYAVDARDPVSFAAAVADGPPGRGRRVRHPRVSGGEGRSPMKMYNELASWWPLVSPPSHYVEEAADLLPTLMQAADAPPTTLLELGCGGGSLAFHFKPHLRLTLSDISPEMLPPEPRDESRVRARARGYANAGPRTHV